MLNDSQTKQTNLDRREFLARSTQAVAGMAVFSAATKLAAEETPAESNPFGEVSDFLNKGKSLRPHRFQPIKVDHEKARAEYAELIQVIPAAERWKSPYPANAKNAFPGLRLALEKLYVTQETVLGIKDNQDSAFLDNLAEAEDLPIPWTKPNDFAFIQKYFRANESFSQAITRDIQQSDYCSVQEKQELGYAEDTYRSQYFDMRNIWYFLKQKTLAHTREQAWDQAFTQLQVLIKLAALHQNTKVSWLDATFQFGFLGMVHDLCLSIARHPKVPTPVVEKAFALIQTLKKHDPDFALYHRIELQTFFASTLAQIPLTKSLRDQAPALVMSAYIDKPGDDVALSTDKRDVTRESMISHVRYFERAIPCLTNHPKPFDKKQSMLTAWKALNAFLAEFQKHEFPAVTMNWDQEEFKLLDLLADKVRDDQDFSDIQRLMNEAKSGLRAPEPLPAELQQRLTKEFQAIENPLGLLYVAYYFTTFRNKNPYAIAVPREQRLAAKVLIACLLFERSHQRRPKTLAELVEHKLLDKVPNSAVTGEPFGYEPQLGRIWRTGKDGTPDGKIPDGEAEDEGYHAMLGIYPLIPIG